MLLLDVASARNHKDYTISYNTGDATCVWYHVYSVSTTSYQRGDLFPFVKIQRYVHHTYTRCIPVGIN